MPLPFSQLAAIQQLENILEYKFGDPLLAFHALHRGQKGSFDNIKFEQLEFLGDRIYNLCVTSQLVSETNKNTKVGTIEARHQMLVRNGYLASAAEHYGINKLLVDSYNKKNQFIPALANTKRLADVVEAIFGAMFTDSSCNFLTVYRVYLAKFHSEPWKDIVIEKPELVS